MPWGVLALMVFASLAVALFVSWPLLMGKAEPDNAEDEGPVDQLLSQKESVYSAIKELEFDHAMGNLSEEDYRELSGRYEDRAVALLQSIDEVATADDETETYGSSGGGGGMSRSRVLSAEDAIEQEIAALRAKRRAKSGHPAGRDLGDAIEEQVAAIRLAKQGKAAGLKAPPGALEPSPRSTCPSCAAPVKNSDAAYCSRCGASLDANCASCGRTVEPDDLFCSGCGARLGPRGNRVEMTTVGGSNA